MVPTSLLQLSRLVISFSSDSSLDRDSLLGRTGLLLFLQQGNRKTETKYFNVLNTCVWKFLRPRPYIFYEIQSYDEHFILCLPRDKAMRTCQALCTYWQLVVVSIRANIRTAPTANMTPRLNQTAQLRFAFNTFFFLKDLTAIVMRRINIPRGIGTTNTCIPFLLY